jgi:hypothetical protein
VLCAPSCGVGARMTVGGPTELNIFLRVSGFGPLEPSGLCGHVCAWMAPWGPLWALLGCRGANEGGWVGCALGHLRGSAGFNICLRGSGFEPLKPSAQGANSGYRQYFEGPENGILRFPLVFRDLLFYCFVALFFTFCVSAMPPGSPNFAHPQELTQKHP